MHEVPAVLPVAPHVLKSTQAGIPPTLSDVGVEDLARSLAASQPALFLDFDGTLAPIRARPDMVRMDKEMRERLRRLAPHCPVAVLGGRDVRELRELVALDGPVHAGCHGFEIEMADRRHIIGEGALPN